MPRCLVCGDTFEARSWGSPAEPCLCGMEVSQRDWNEASADELRRIDNALNRWDRDKGEWKKDDVTEEQES